MTDTGLTVSKDMIVTIDFTLTLDDGEVAETTQGGMPLRYLAGHDQLLPALEAALDGLGSGDEIGVTLSPEEGYGEYDEDGFEEVPPDAFPAGQELDVSDGTCKPHGGGATAGTPPANGTCPAGMELDATDGTCKPHGGSGGGSGRG